MKANLQTQVEAKGVIHPDTRMGAVHLTVADLERQINFYQKVIGLQVHHRDGTAERGRTAALGAGKQDLLILTEEPGARRYRGTTGLYHFALLLPDRRELARVIARLQSLRYLNYPTDHVMTKTTYLDDPEGQNIEIYVDTPEDGMMAFVNGTPVVRRVDGRPSSGRDPVDLDALFRELTPQDRLDAPLPPGTSMGHVHLYVANLDETMRFYHEILGFDNMGIAASFRMGMVSAGGYHHHIGFNTWVGEGAPPPPPGALGLRYITVETPVAPELERVIERIRRAGLPAAQVEEGILVRDPSENSVLLTARANG